jgi:hypothetical protein
VLRASLHLKLSLTTPLSLYKGEATPTAIDWQSDNTTALKARVIFALILTNRFEKRIMDLIAPLALGRYHKTEASVHPKARKPLMRSASCCGYCAVKAWPPRGN